MVLFNIIPCVWLECALQATKDFKASGLCKALRITVKLLFPLHQPINASDVSLQFGVVHILQALEHDDHASI